MAGSSTSNPGGGGGGRASGTSTIPPGPPPPAGVAGSSGGSGGGGNNSGNNGGGNNGGGPPPGPSRAERESVIDLSSYPILTQDVSSIGTAAPSVAGDASIGRTVTAAIAGVLGWRPKEGDTRGFLAALDGAFTLSDVEGHVEWTYNPRSYAAQADLGTVTGAQASIYTRAKAAMDQALPLLRGLTPLRPDFDPVDCESIRAIITTELTDIPVALSQPGGPVVQRVDELFKLLGATTAVADSLEGLTGQLQLFRDRFGLTRNWVNTVEQEENLTNFIILVDYVNTLWMSWNTQRGYFTRDGKLQPYLGTQLVLLSRQLGVITESVDELRYVLDSVFVDQAERETILLQFGGVDTPIYLEDLLKWVQEAAAEARNTIQDSGKDGVMTFARTARLLRKITGGLLSECEARRSGRWTRDLPEAFEAPRVYRAVRELHDQLDKAWLLARQVNRNADPVVTAVLPQSPVVSTFNTSAGAPYQAVAYTALLLGTGFQTGASVQLTAGGTPANAAAAGMVGRVVPIHHNGTFMSFTALVVPPGVAPPLPLPPSTVVLPLQSGTAVGTTSRWRLVVVNPDGGEWDPAADDTLILVPAGAGAGAGATTTSP